MKVNEKVETKIRDGTVLSRRVFRLFNPNNQKDVELVFGVNLENRTWSIEADEKCYVVTFFDPNNAFGFMARLSIADFFKKLDKNNLYLKLK